VKKVADPATAARSAAIALLARRDLASSELRGKLEQRGVEASVATAAVAELMAEGAVDDVRYAGNYVTYRAARGQGPVRIATDLRSMGLADEVIETALAGAPDWGSLARAVRSRKFGSQEPASWAEKARQARFLQYRGFSSDHIRSALGADVDPD
jgi:regulatory protein